MNDVERLESLRGRVQHLGTVSIEDTRWMWEMARRVLNYREDVHAAAFYRRPNYIPPLSPPRKRCRECGGDCVIHATPPRTYYDSTCPACGGEGYQQSGNPGEFGEWPPEPPPRPKMVWASVDDDSPRWWVLVDYDESPWLACRTTCGGMWAAGNELVPHDHPEQSAEESRRILEEEKNS